MTSHEGAPLQPEDMSEMLAIIFAGHRALRHNLGAPIEIASGYTDLILAGILPSKDKALLDTLRLVASSLDRARRVTDAYLRHFSNYEPKNMFAARPAEIVETIGRNYPNADIRVLPPSPHALSVSYPGVALFVILDELVSNAVAHGGGAVAIGWRLEGARLLCSVHDSGPRVPERGPDFATLQSQSWLKGDGGLQAVDAVVYRSKGFLFFRDSTITTGAEVLVDIPSMVRAESRNEMSESRQ